MTVRSARRTIAKRVRRLMRFGRVGVRHRSSFTNVYHCCVQKTASRWIRRIMVDRRVYTYSGLGAYDYYKANGVHRGKLDEMIFAEPMPRNTIATPLYTDFAGFQSVPKPEHYRAFFVMRDPRDIVISWYFSMKHSHPLMDGLLAPLREKLQGLSESDGIRYAIHALSTRTGLFEALDSWIESSNKNSNVLVLRFEDLTAPDNLDVFMKIMEHCDITIPEKMLAELLGDYSFAKLTGGRKRGEEDSSAHLRKGTAGDWRNHFDDRILSYFESETGGLTARLGYE